MTYIQELIDNCHLASGASPVRQFVIDDFVNQDLAKLDGIKTAIYRIEQLEGDPEKTFLDMSEFKKLGARKCPKLNAPSPILYIGSSTTGLRGRIEQHIGNKHKNTYALHLTHWCENRCRLTVYQYDLPIAIVQIIEDSMSHDEKPAFGKTGGNNK